MDIKDKISFAINQISVNNCDGSANENAIKAVRYLQEVHEALSQHDVSGSLLMEIKTLLEQYRDEEMPNWNAPFHYDAEGWEAMKYFIQWLERRSNDR